MANQIAMPVMKYNEPGIHVISGEDEVHQMLHEASGNYPSVRIQIRKVGDKSNADGGAADPEAGAAGDRAQLKGNLSEILCAQKAFVIEFQTAAQAQAAAEACEKATKDGDEILLIVASPRKQIFLGMRFARAKLLPGAPGNDRSALDLVFDFPERMHRIQRRRDVRWVVPGAYEIGVDVPMPNPEKPTQPPSRVSFPLVDLSRSGMSFRIEEEESATLFWQGMTLPQLAFTVQGRRYVVDGEVTSEKPIAIGKRGFKIGVRFIRVDDEISESLAEFVLMAALHLVA